MKIKDLKALPEAELKVYLERCELIVQSVMTHFSDGETTGYYFTSNDHESLIARKKEWWDNATPSGNSSMLQVLTSLYYITVDSKYEEAMRELRQGYTGLIARNPHGVPHALAALMAEQNGIEVIKAKDVDNFEKLAAALRKLPYSRRFAMLTDADNQPPGYQRCIGSMCLQPVNDPAQLYN